MRILEFGRVDGPVTALIHGYGASWRSWRPYIDALEGRFRLVVAALGGLDPDGQSEFGGVEAEAGALAVRRRQNRSLKEEGLARKAPRRSYMAPIAADVIETCSRMSDHSCERVQRSAFGYRARPSLGEAPGKIVYWYGSKEEGMLKNTIRLLKALRPGLELRRFDGLHQGQLWAERGARFAREAEAFWGSK